MSEQMGQADRDLVNYIISHTEQTGVPPSVRQIAEQIGCASPSAAQKRLAKLIEAGVVQRSPGVARGIKINRERLAEFG